jgi:hypothetical protein
MIWFSYLTGLSIELNDLQQQRLNKDIIISNLPIVDNLDTKMVFEKNLQLFEIDQSVIFKQYNVINTRRKYQHINVTFTTEGAKSHSWIRKKNSESYCGNNFFPKIF